MMFVYLSVCSKNLANRWTYMVLLFRVASHRSWEGYFGGKVTPPSQEKSPLEKNRVDGMPWLKTVALNPVVKNEVIRTSF
jgi:hypothetical protein